MTSIIEESQKARKIGILGFWRNKKFFIPVLLVIILTVTYFLFFQNNNTQTEVETQKEWTVKKDDIVVSVESDGKVVAEDGVELSFSVGSGNLEVKEVFIKEGDTVSQGDKIASVKTDDLELSLNSAYVSYRSSLADYNETMDGPTTEQLQDAEDRITEAEISLGQYEFSFADIEQNIDNSIYNAEKVLKKAKEDLDKNRNFLNSEDVENKYEDLVDTIKSFNVSLEGILKDSDEIVGVDKTYLNDDFEQSLGVKDISSYSDAKLSYKKSKTQVDEFNQMSLGISINSSYDQIDEIASHAYESLESLESHLYDMKILLDNTITSNNLTENELNSFISSINSNRTSVNTKISTLNADLKAIEDIEESLSDYQDDYDEALRDLEIAKSEAERDLANAESNIDSKELNIEQAKRDYEELKAPLSDAELASARSRLTSASISLKRAQNSLDEATIVSPIEGEVVELNYKKGDIIVDNDNPVAVILNSKTLFIQVAVEEADVSKLEVEQKAYAVFDALDELKLEGEISFISLISSTNNNGIVTYEVRVLINNPGEKQIREGMTAYMEFVSSEARDVLSIPVSAVRNVSGEPSVQSLEGTWIPVTTGFTDGKYVEVIGGLGVGEKILY
jgi:RND family efflux transporter MFP subunit